MQDQTQDMQFTFQDRGAEAHFALYFSERVFGTAWLLTVLMALVWLTRVTVVYLHCKPPFSPGCTIVGLTCAFMGLAHTYIAVSSSHFNMRLKERAKAQLIVLDLTACMFVVLLSDGQQSFPILFSPVMVYVIHGWMVPFGGCRLVADMLLHSLNLMVLTILQLDASSRGSSLTWQSCVVLVLACCLLPLCVNMVHEARYRVRFMRQQRQHFNASPLWSAVYTFAQS